MLVARFLRYCLVNVGIERFAHRLNRRDVPLAEQFKHLPMYQYDAGAERIAVRGIGRHAESTFEIIDQWQESEQQILGRTLCDHRPFPLDPLAEIVELRGLAKQEIAKLIALDDQLASRCLRRFGVVSLGGDVVGSGCRGS